MSTADAELPVVQDLVDVEGSPGHLTPVNDTAAGITHAGSGWGYSSGRGDGDFGNGVHSTTSNGDSVSYTVTGTGIMALTELNNDEGNIGLYIDGSLSQTVSASTSGQRAAQDALMTITTTHTLQVVKTGGSYMIVDAINVTGTATVGGSGGGNPGSFPSGYHPLVVASDGLCLDGFGNTSAAGAIIDQWACNGQTNQEFQFVPVSGGYGQLQIQNSGQDITVSWSSTSQGVPDIVQEPASSSTASMWKPQQQSDGSWSFQNDNSGLCLDVYGAGANQGQQLDQWPCKNGPGTNQDFTP